MVIVMIFISTQPLDLIVCNTTFFPEILPVRENTKHNFFEKHLQCENKFSLNTESKYESLLCVFDFKVCYRKI